MSYTICKYCVAERGIKGSELAENHLETAEDMANHIESEHNICVIRKDETEDQAYKRFYKRYPEARDRSTCKCPECQQNRKLGITIN